MASQSPPIQEENMMSTNGNDDRATGLRTILEAAIEQDGLKIALAPQPSSLAAMEAVIEQNLGAVFETGRALMEIRDGELYREAGFDDFTEYLNSKSWGFDRSRAYRQIDAAIVHALVSPIGEINEGQARELAVLLKKSTP